MRRKLKRNLRFHGHDDSSDDEKETDDATAVTKSLTCKSDKPCLSFTDEMSPAGCWTTNRKTTQDRKTTKKQSSRPESVASKLHLDKPSDCVHEFNITVKPLTTKRKINITSSVSETQTIRETLLSEDATDDLLCSSTAIPDAQIIHEARLRRRQMRDALERGEIPLRSEDTSANKKSIYEGVDEASDDSNTDQNVVHFNTSVSIAANERRVIRDQFLTCEQGSDENEESDDSEPRLEVDRFSTWELEQIRKGVGIRPQAMFISNCDKDRATAEMVSAAQSLIASVANSSSLQDSESNEKFASLQVPKFRKRLTLSQIQDNIIKRIQSIDVSVQQYKRELENLRDISSSDSTKHEECKENIETNCLFLNALKEYAFDIRECMSEKFPILEDLEQKYKDVIGRRSQAIKDRRRVDVSDQDHEFSCAKFVSDVILTSDPRTPVDPDRQQRSFQRERRHDKILKSVDVVNGKHLPSDSEDLTAESSLNSDEVKILARYANLWTDVDDHFVVLTSVLSVLTRWREQHSSSYSSVRKFIYLTVIAPVLRCAAFKWNPLQTPLDNEQWISEIIAFGESCDKEWTHLTHLLPRIILPILSRYASIYDPARTSQTKCFTTSIEWLFKCCKELEVRECASFCEIESTIKKQIEEMSEKDVFIPLYPNAVVQHQTCGASKFLQYQFLFQLRLFRNVMDWHTILKTDFIIASAIDKILNRCILLSLKCQNCFTENNSQLCIQVAQSIPGQLIACQANRGKTIPELSVFCQYIMEAAKFHMCVKSTSSHLCLQLRECLVRLNSLDMASELIQ